MMTTRARARLVCGAALRRGPCTYDEIIEALDGAFEYQNAMIAEVERRGYLVALEDDRLDMTPVGLKCMTSDPRVDPEVRDIAARRVDRMMAALEPLICAVERLPPRMTDRDLQGRVSVRVEDIAPECSGLGGLLAQWSRGLVREKEDGSLVVQIAAREQGELRKRLAEGEDWCWPAGPDDTESDAADSGDEPRDEHPAGDPAMDGHSPISESASQPPDRARMIEAAPTTEISLSAEPPNTEAAFTISPMWTDAKVMHEVTRRKLRDTADATAEAIVRGGYGYEFVPKVGKWKKLQRGEHGVLRDNFRKHYWRDAFRDRQNAAAG